MARKKVCVLPASNPTRTVIIGPAFYNSIDHLEELKLPKEDHHLIVTVHYYSPMDFTHQGAPWAAKYKFGWSWAYWQFDSNFIVYDIQRRSWVEPIYHALIPQGGSVAVECSRN